MNSTLIPQHILKRKRVIQQYFEPKIGRTIRIFIMGQKNYFLPKKKRVQSTIYEDDKTQYEKLI